MTYAALVEHFSEHTEFPIQFTDVIAWVKSHTDHKIINLYSVPRGKKAYRGAFRRVAFPIGGLYSQDYDIVTTILYGSDLTQDWKNLVITKEILHVFDPAPMQVTTLDMVRDLIPAIIHPDLKAKLLPEFADTFGPYRALPVLIPMKARLRLKDAVENGKKSIEEVATYLDVPPEFVDMWLRYGDQLFETCMKY